MKHIIHRIRAYVRTAVDRKMAERVASYDDKRFYLHLLRMSTKKRIEDLYEDPAACARAIGLTYACDHTPGIRRMKSGQGFSYRDASDRMVRDRATLKRIRSLVIPPAWTDVWICSHPAGHLQATGRDARGRKQYRYHPLWNRMRSMTKYHRLAAFGMLLPRVRERIRKDLRLHGFPREKVLAAVVTLLEKTLIRIGNEEYARENKSFGLTTMKNKHVTIKGSVMQFHFRGKSGVIHTVDLTDSRLAKIVQRCQEIPGRQLFEYVDDEGTRQSISSEDVNAYLQDVMGDDFTAKDYRTWRGTVLAAQALCELGPCSNQSQEKKMINEAIKRVSSRLGNTPTVCRKYYVHPAIIAAYQAGTLTKTSRPEQAVLSILQN